MTRLGWAVVLGICAVVALICGFLAWHHIRTEKTTPPEAQATSTPTVNPSTLSIYTSGQYGFAFFYPSTAIVTDAYSSTTLAGIPWRIGSSGGGTPIVRIQKDDEEMRVGVSKDQRELKACTQVYPAETPQGAFKVGSTTWQKFTFQKIGTDNEELVTSYRTVHANACFAVEVFQPLSSAASTTPAASSTRGYTIGDTITSFSFAD